MDKFFIIIFLFIGFTVNAQSFIGNTKEEIINHTEAGYGDLDISYVIIDDSLTILTIQDDYEILSYYLVDDICVKFVVTKPYSCNCLSSDIMAYNSKLTSIGKMKWISKDSSKLYELKMEKKNYLVTIALNNEEMLFSSNK